MKYVLECPNEACAEYAVPVEAANYRMKYDKTTKQMKPEFNGKTQCCACCGTELQFAEAPSVIPDFSVGTFKGLPDEKKKEVLHKRFQKGMAKGGNDENELRKRGAVKKLIGYDD